MRQAREGLRLDKGVLGWNEAVRKGVRHASLQNRIILQVHIILTCFNLALEKRHRIPRNLLSPVVEHNFFYP